MVVLLREFASPDDEMKRIVLKVVAQCVGADGVPASYVRDEVLPGFFEHFWVRRMALDRRAYKSVLETTVEVARKVGGACVLGRIVEDLKDEAEPYRRLVMDAVRRILREQGAADVDARLEELLVDGALYAYQEQGDDDGDEKSNSASSKIVLDGFGAIVSSLGRRAKPYLAQVCGTIKWRLNNRAPRVRAQAADLVAAVAPTMVRFFFFRRLVPLAFASLLFLRAPRERKTYVCLPSLDHIFFSPSKKLSGKKNRQASCGEDKLLSHLGVVLFEYLGEEFPDVLASILGALGAIVAVVYSSGGSGVDSASVAERMQPPVRDLLPRLTPILKNRHERVQETCVDLVGRIADRAAEGVPAREWMRVCFELLELLKAPKLAVRRAAVSTFGFIARAIGPQDVLVALLNNLKVQERQMRVCTTVAIAVVAEACGPFTVLPALMNEYRTPENNVQNGERGGKRARGETGGEVWRCFRVLSEVFSFVSSFSPTLSFFPPPPPLPSPPSPPIRAKPIDQGSSRPRPSSSSTSDGPERTTSTRARRSWPTRWPTATRCTGRRRRPRSATSRSGSPTSAARTRWCTCSTCCGPISSSRPRTSRARWRSPSRPCGSRSAPACCSSTCCRGCSTRRGASGRRTGASTTPSTWAPRGRWWRSTRSWTRSGPRGGKGGRRREERGRRTRATKRAARRATRTRSKRGERSTLRSSPRPLTGARSWTFSSRGEDLAFGFLSLCLFFLNARSHLLFLFCRGYGREKGGEGKKRPLSLFLFLDNVLDIALSIPTPFPSA